MKATRPWPSVTITEKGERALAGGHPWVYGGEVTAGENCADGELCDVKSAKGRYLGTGFYNSHSLLRVRLISRNANDLFDEAFWARRVQYAVDYRQSVMGEDFSACRLIFGEADWFPGLTVDKFGDMLVAEVQCLGIDRLRGVIFPLIKRALEERGCPVRGLYERSEGGLRAKEGMEERTGFYAFEGTPIPDSAVVTIVENGVRYRVDIAEGQKTGFFLDQKFNRLAAAQIGKGRHVLDCFTHTGAFALNIAKGGAASVTALDISKEAVEMTAHNAKQNGLAVEAVEADVFDFLTELDKKKDHSYDYIVLDPPAFTKSGKTVHEAFRGYKEINYRAMKILPRGGYLATCSCSHFMGEELFVKMVKEAARDAGVTLRQIEFRQQAPDHPILMTVPETYYLKFFLFQIV